MIGKDIPQSQEVFMKDLAIDIMARTLWGEARGEGLRGMESVASVIMNRVAIADARGGYWWGNDVFAVCQKPYQFSCWNKNDPNRDRILKITKADPVFKTAMDIAARAIAGRVFDPTRGATHYHTKAVKPHWADGRTPCAIIGAHLFYRLED